MVKPDTSSVMMGTNGGATPRTEVLGTNELLSLSSPAAPDAFPHPPVAGLLAGLEIGFQEKALISHTTEVRSVAVASNLPKTQWQPWLTGRSQLHGDICGPLAPVLAELGEWSPAPKGQPLASIWCAELPCVPGVCAWRVKLVCEPGVCARHVCPACEPLAHARPCLVQ